MQKTCMVVGSGVVGLAVARHLSRAGIDVVVAERTRLIGSGISSRNSEVVHGGMYYPKFSLKAKCCVAGRRELYQFCDKFNVPYRKCGKLIVATNEKQVETLVSIQKASLENGMTKENGDALQLLTGNEAKVMEPELSCLAALWSPETGIVDSHSYMMALQADAEAHGTVFAFQTIVDHVHFQDGQFQVHTRGSFEAQRFDMLVNCTGLYAINFAKDVVRSCYTPPGAIFAKGNYYKLQCKAPFDRLIYPVPEQAGLGVHLTIDLDGNARFGPDVEWIDIKDPGEIDYIVDPRRSDSFYKEISKYWPGIPEGSLEPDYSGVRPKTASAG
mmetsp:Transcript_38088/g.61844  ORF Transcript_38088/g.61844 Transcript_38088/m.61844 type:complete len:329 (-) Transcript_38088:1681-2667(-)